MPASVWRVVPGERVLLWSKQYCRWCTSAASGRWNHDILYMCTHKTCKSWDNVYHCTYHCTLKDHSKVYNKVATTSTLIHFSTISSTSYSTCIFCCTQLYTGLHIWVACSVVLTDTWSPNLPGRIGQLSMDMEVWTTWVYMNSAIHHNPCPGSRGFFVTFLKERGYQWSWWTMIMAPDKFDLQ